MSGTLTVNLHTYSPGELVLRRHQGTHTVERANAEIMVSHALLESVAYGKHFAVPCLRLTAPSTGTRRVDDWSDWLLHVDAVDRHLVYKISSYDPQLKAWKASWPD